MKAPEILVIEDDDESEEDEGPNYVHAPFNIGKIDLTSKISFKTIDVDMDDNAEVQVIEKDNAKDTQKDELELKASNQNETFSTIKHKNDVHFIPLQPKRTMQTAMAATNNNNNSNNNTNSTTPSSTSSDDEIEQSPITHLAQPNYERHFRTNIIKPLHHILDSNTQEETLSMVRMNFFIVLQGLFLEAKSIYCKHSMREDTIDNILSAPGLYIPNHTNVYYAYQITQCTFVDPDSESITKKKLIPIVIRTLLKLGDGGGDRKSSFGESYLSVVAEDLVACILLDFVGMVCKILSLVDYVIPNHHDDGDDNEDDGCSSSSKKRRKIEQTQESSSTSPSNTPTSTSSSSSLPNILDFIGDDILSTFTRVLASEACYAGYNQSLRLLRLEDKSHETTTEDAVHTYLPSFFKSHPYDDNDHNTTIDSMKDEYLSPLRSGEWIMYFSLYHSKMDLSVAKTQKNQQQSEEDDLGLKSLMNSPASFESRDPPSTNSAPPISRHLIALARYFVSCKGLDYLNKIVACSLNNHSTSASEDKQQMLPINVSHLENVLAIYRSISFLSSFSAANANSSTDCLHNSSIMVTMIQFKSTLKSYFHSILLDLLNLSQGEHRIILELLGAMDERSLAENECAHLQQCLGSASSSTPATITPYLDLTSSDSSEIKLSILWKLFTGQVIGEGDADDSPAVVSPSLQCQILALNEVIQWLKNLQSMMKECRDRYDDICMNTNAFGAAESKNDELYAVPRLVPNNEVVKVDSDGEINDNESTEVCCNSNDSISSANTDAENSLKANKAEKLDDCDEMEVDHDNRGTSSFQILQSSEQRLIAVLNLLKTKFNILGHVFSPHGLHSEILKRSLPLLEIFAQNKKINKDDIKLMWDVTGFSTSKTLVNSHVHISVSSAVFELMLGLINTNWISLGSDILSYFGGLFQEVIDHRRWTRQSLYLVELVASRSIDLILCEKLSNKIADEIRIPAGIDLLWRLSQVENNDVNSSFSMEAFDTAFGSLLRIFEHLMAKCIQRNNGVNIEQEASYLNLGHQERRAKDKMQRLQTYIIRRAIDSIQDTSQCLNKTVNIRLLHYLITQLPLTMKRARDQLLLSVEDVVKYYNLSTIITDEMSSYVTLVKQRLSNRPSEQSLDMDNHILVGGMYTHKECVFHRQQLFQTFVVKCFELIELESKSTICNGSDNKEKSREVDDLRQITNFVEDEADGGCVYASSLDQSNDDNFMGIGDSMTRLLPSRDDVTQIWANYVSNGDTLSTAECIIEMFHFLVTSSNAKTGSSVPAFEWRKEMVKTLYPLCCCLDAKSVSIAGYRLLIYCVGHINALDGIFRAKPYNHLAKCIDIESKLNMMSNILLGLSYNFDGKAHCASSLHLRSMSLITETSSYKLLGLDFLWSIVLECLDENVANMAMVYIAVLYTFPASKENLREFSSEQVNFVQKCIVELKLQNKSGYNIKRQIRILRLLKLFVQNAIDSSSESSHGSFAEKINSVQVGNIIGVSLPLTVFIQVLNGPKFPIHCHLGKNSRIAFIRDSITSYFGSKLWQDFRLIYCGRELKDNSATFENQEIKPNCMIYCCPRMSTKHLKVKESIHVVEQVIDDGNEVENGQAMEVESSLSEKIPTARKCRNDSQMKSSYKDPVPGILELLSSGCMKFLFTLLSYYKIQDVDMLHRRQLVWDLLQLLPTEPILQEGIDEMLSGNKRTSWAQLIPTPNDNGDTRRIFFRLLYSLQVFERAFTQLSVSSDGIGKVAKDENHEKENEREYNNNVVDQGIETNAVFVIDEDDEENHDIASSIKNVDDGSDKLDGDDGIASKECVENFLYNEGLQHLVNLFLSLGDCYFNRQNQDSQLDHEISTLAVTCANKLIFLIATVTGEYKAYPCDSRISLVTSGKCSPFFTILLKLIHWAITFQVRSKNDEKLFD